MEPLRTILGRARTGLESGWLYLPANETWKLDTPGVVIDCDALVSHEVDENGEPLHAAERNLICTLDSATIEDIVSFVANIGIPITDEWLLESFIYYYDHDAFLPEPGFKALNQEEAVLKADRTFYDLLGSERASEACRKPGCFRGAVEHSVFCKAHHFESILKKPCPFKD